MKYALRIIRERRGNMARLQIRKTDDSGNIIPNNQRMKYEHIILNDDTATIPSEADVNAKIQEIKDADTAKINKKASGKQKLKDLGLDDDEIKALTGA